MGSKQKERKDTLNLILLSGGSGTRLWPLSNEIRSKQFIKLFKTGHVDEPYESMVQRVYRQITSVSPSATVTIATSKSQVSAIKNQLGSKVSVCVEPCRRDTFPAIALAAAYLHDVKGVDLDEPVVVCPVDPYVEDSYYEAIARLADLAKTERANLTLMGIEPAYPSEKYGYIIPEAKEEVSFVSEFKEKPSAEKAAEYISRGALWNAGVFAFKLGYLLEKAHQLIDFNDYNDLFNGYAALEKISFDYAVAEKEQSIQVMRYAGEWKDIGTWNMLTEVMTEPIKGSALLDETCTNTNVINELDIPVLGMGLKDIVIAVSGDGILVADKERSGYMKPYVEKISTEIKFAEKSWGTYTVIDAQPGAMTVKITLKADGKMTYHCHELRDECWNIIEGEGEAVVDGETIPVKKGSNVLISRGKKHTLIARTDMTVIEVQTGEEISKEDKIIIER